MKSAIAELAAELRLGRFHHFSADAGVYAQALMKRPGELQSIAQV
jgi:hypothetical protein